MKGRKPNEEQTVVPMREDGEASSHNLDERARARMLELEPENINPEHREIYRRLALPLCHPTRDRLNPGNIFMFHQLVRVVARHEALLVAIEDGETYATKTRDGVQHKAKPEVAQVNETFRQIRAVAGEFGMTPATERAIAAPGQLGFNFPELDSAEDYLT